MNENSHTPIINPVTYEDIQRTMEKSYVGPFHGFFSRNMRGETIQNWSRLGTIHISRIKQKPRIYDFRVYFTVGENNTEAQCLLAQIFLVWQDYYNVVKFDVGGDINKGVKCVCEKFGIYKEGCAGYVAAIARDMVENKGLIYRHHE